MSIFDPFADVTRLRRQIGRLLDETPASPAAAETSRVWSPPVDLYEDEDALSLRLDLPGVNQESLDVQLTGDELVVRGERKPEPQPSGAGEYTERPFGQFRRSLRLALPVQHDAVQASYRDGVLTIRLPKAESLKPRKVVVNAEPEA